MQAEIIEESIGRIFDANRSRPIIEAKVLLVANSEEELNAAIEIIRNFNLIDPRPERPFVFRPVAEQTEPQQSKPSLPKEKLKLKTPTPPPVEYDPIGSLEV